MNIDVSETSIANMALGHIGINKQIANIETDRSVAGNAIRQFYNQIRDQVLADGWWSFGTAFATLNLVQTNPTTEWGYSYRVPSNSLFVRRVMSGLRTDSRQSRVPFKEGADSSGRLLFTDMENAQIEYMMDQIDPKMYTTDFVMAFSLLLGATIAPQVTAGDPFGMMSKTMARYETQIGKAQANNYNEEQPDIEPESEFIRARGGNYCSPFRRWPWEV